MFSLARIAPLAAATLILAALTCAMASAETEHAERAKVLHKLNPAGNLGGKSIVGTQPGQHLHGVEGKPNFMIALADGITIHGASANDELGVGAHANDVRILAPESGHSLIVGGPGSTIVVGGKGHNHVVSHARGAKVVLKSPHDKVVVNGRDSRVVCVEEAHHELIKVDEDVEVSERCRGHHDKIKTIEGSSTAKRPRITSRAVTFTGRGTNEDPYTAKECNGNDYPIGCHLAFPPRVLKGLWANEHVPAYKCPAQDPWLRDVEYAPFGTTLPDGVEVAGLGPVGVSITASSREPAESYPGYEPGPNDHGQRNGTKTGSNFSSATNWTIGTVAYQVVLHCMPRAYTDPGFDPGPG
jgi:hypothetical protein